MLKIALCLFFFLISEWISMLLPCVFRATSSSPTLLASFYFHFCFGRARILYLLLMRTTFCVRYVYVSVLEQ